MEAYITVRNCNFGEVVIATLDDKLLSLEFIPTDNKDTLEYYENRIISKGIAITYLNTNPDLISKILYCLDNNTYDHSIGLYPIGTVFQKTVWKALCQVSAGTTVSYKQIAEAIGNPRSVRAVGTACKNNPIAYFIPCHRVLPSNGEIGQYRWGIDIKRQLLNRENITNVAQRQEVTVLRSRAM